MEVTKVLMQLEGLESLSVHYHKNAPAVSSVSVGWHLEHMLLVISKIIEGLALSDPSKFSPKINFSKLLVMTFGYIPRNKGKAPKFTLPQDTDVNELGFKINHIRKELSQMEFLPAHSYISHPYFGHLNAKESLRFLYIHTRHHLKIIRDIIQ